LVVVVRQGVITLPTKLVASVDQGAVAVLVGREGEPDREERGQQMRDMLAGRAAQLVVFVELEVGAAHPK
jgi:hypothetical protein